MNSTWITCVAEKWLKSQIMRLKKKKKKNKEGWKHKCPMWTETKRTPCHLQLCFSMYKSTRGKPKFYYNVQLLPFLTFFFFFLFTSLFNFFLSKAKVVLDTVYFIEIETLLLKVLLIKIKISWNSTMKLINNTVRLMNSTKKYNAAYE